MPWKCSDTMDQRVQFIRDWLTHQHYVSELCTRYAISRKTGYKWISRYLSTGPDGLMERGHQAKTIRHRTDPQVELALLGVRGRHPSWGPKKIIAHLRVQQPALKLPHRTTVSEILKRNGLIHPRPTRRKVGHPGKPSVQVLLPNDCWSIDFKGQFRTGDGKYCYPLTVTDNYSRYLLAVKALPGPLLAPTKAVLTALFKKHGLPKRIRSDNGTPFAAHTLGRLSQLSVWLLKLGIHPELIEPGKPQQNGRHERMHRTLKDETTKPPAKDIKAQQRKFTAFQRIFNDERPHEALDMDLPTNLYTVSPRPMPSKLLSPEYPDRFERRLVSANGGIRWKRTFVNVTSALIGEYVGLEEIAEGQWDVYYGTLRLGRFHERLMRIEDCMGKLVRRV
jgi:putative transposase